MAQVTGIVTVKVDGDMVRSKAGASIDLGGYERTTQKGHSIYGYSEELMPSIVSFTLAHVGKDDLIGLQSKVDSTLQFDTDTGDSYIVRNAFSSKTAVLTGGEGDVAFEYMGHPAELG